MSLPSLGWRKLFDHLIRPQQQRLRDRQPERLSGELETDELLDAGGTGRQGCKGHGPQKLH